MAESTVGDLVADLGSRKAFFLATKVGAEGREPGVAQLEASMRRLRTDTLDLVQVHNLRDFATQMATLREWKAVTCAVPGTAQVKYVADNLGAAQGRLPDAAMRRRMEQFIDAL
jgi:aryl-alcohol dehydrogenase-like predicted oxidoreductase